MDTWLLQFDIPVGKTWSPEREQWWTSVSSQYENISSIGDALSCCYSLMESSWVRRSNGFKYLSDHKLCHCLSSCKTFINLAILTELQTDKNEASWWFWTNVITSALSAVMFVFTTFLVARLRRLARVRQKMQRFLPHSLFKHKDSKKRTPWYKKSKKEKPDVGLHQPWQHSGSRYPPSCVPAIQHEPDTPGMPGGHYLVARARTEWPTANEVNTTERQR